MTSLEIRLESPPPRRHFSTQACRAGIMLALAWLVPGALAQTQSPNKPDNHSITGVEEVLAQARCLTLKYRPNGEVAYYACMDAVMDQMALAKKLRYFEGTWKLRAALHATPWSQVGRFNRTEQNAWVADDASLVSHWKEQQPAGIASGATTFEYDLNRKLYIFHENDRSGAKSEGTGTLHRNAWVWLGQTRLSSGKTVKSRWTVHPVSPSSYQFKLEIAPPGGKWTTVMQGSATKSE